MNNNPRPRPSPPRPLPALLDLQTAPQIFSRATAVFLSHLPTFLFLAFLILTFRTNVENGTHFVTAFIDRDPSLKSLLSRLDISGKSLYSSSSSSPSPPPPSDSLLHHRHNRRRRPPFLHLTRVGTLDDDFFSGDDEYDRSLFGGHPKPRPNSTFVMILGDFDPQLGASSFVANNGVRVSEIARSGLSFKLPESSSRSAEEESDDFEDEQGGRFVDLQFFINGLQLGRRDAMSLFFLISMLSAAYGYVILGFLVTYSWVLGIVFVAVVNDLLGRYRSFTGNLWDGSRIGLKRLSGFILMKWAIRDALTQLLGLWFFGEMEDQYSFFRIFVRLKLMPFSIMSPWIRGFERELSGFLLAWFVLDTVVGFVFSMDSWIAIVDPRRRGREIIKEGCYLLSTMLKQAIVIKCLESVLCGSFTRWAFTKFFGKLLASTFQSVMEVYFMVAWLIFFIAVKFKDANSLGRTFGRRDLEGFMVDGLR